MDILKVKNTSLKENPPNIKKQIVQRSMGKQHSKKQTILIVIWG